MCAVRLFRMRILRCLCCIWRDWLAVHLSCHVWVWFREGLNCLFRLRPLRKCVRWLRGSLEWLRRFQRRLKRVRWEEAVYVLTALEPRAPYHRLSPGRPDLDDGHVWAARLKFDHIADVE